MYAIAKLRIQTSLHTEKLRKRKRDLPYLSRLAVSDRDLTSIADRKMNGNPLLSVSILFSVGACTELLPFHKERKKNKKKE